MYRDILPPLGWNKDKIEIKYPTISVKDLTKEPFIDSVAKQIREAQDELIMRGSIRLFDDYITNPYAIVKLNNEKETKKMEAKKCDRCGKLYETKFDQNYIQCLFKHEEPFFKGEEEKYSKEFIEDRKTHEIYVKRGNGEYIDMCPDCRESFKKWFENADKEKK